MAYDAPVHQPECRARQTLDLDCRDMLVDPGMQQGLAGLPIGRRDAALCFEFDPVSAAFRPYSNRIPAAVEQNSVVLRNLDPRSGELAVDRRLALPQAAAGQGRREQDHTVRFDKPGWCGKPAGEFFGDEIGRQRAGAKPRLRRDRRQKRDVVLHAGDIKLIQSAGQPVDGGVSFGTRDDEFRYQRVVVDADLGAFEDPGVEAYAFPARWLVPHEAADRGQKIPRRVLGIDPRLDGPAGELHILLGEGERLAGRYRDHQLDEIEPGHQLGDRVLDLKPRVHFEKIEIALLVDDELDRAGRAIIDGPRQRDCLPAHRFAGFGIEKRARRLLDDLLMTTLDRTFSLAKVDDVAMAVAEHLDLDMPRLFYVFFNKDPIVRKTGPRLARRRAKPVSCLVIVRRDPHTLAATTGRGLDHDRVPDVAGDRDGGIGIGNDVEVTGHARYPGGARQLLRLDLVAHRGDRLRRRADEGHSGLRERPGESRIFRQKPVAGVDC